MVCLNDTQISYQLHIYDVTMFFSKVHLNLIYRGGPIKQFGKVCGYHMGFRGAYSHSKLHCKFGITLNSTTAATNCY